MRALARHFGGTFSEGQAATAGMVAWALIVGGLWWPTIGARNESSNKLVSGKHLGKSLGLGKAWKALLEIWKNSLGKHVWETSLETLGFGKHI